MECNRDEAIRAKSMAEFKLERNDFSSAMKFALKAQKLYPKIEGISKLLSMLEVYLSAERKIGGEADWYGVLRVDPTADEETISKQFKRLALEMHPDKNSLVGASGAFKLISEAKCLLLDRERRTMYDRIAGYQPFPQAVPTEAGGPSAPADSSWAHPNVPFTPTASSSQAGGSGTHANAQFAPGASSSHGAGGSGARPDGPFAPGASSSHPDGPFAPAPSSSQAGGSRAHADDPFVQEFPDFTFEEWAKGFPKQSKAQGKRPKKPAARTSQNIDLFWTICHKCRMQFQYRMIFRNIVITCRHCDNVFMAVEVPWPISRPMPWTPPHQQGHKDPSTAPQPGPSPFGPGNFEAGNSSSSQPQQPGLKNFGSGVFEAGSSSGTASQQQDPPHEANPVEGADPSGAGAAAKEEEEGLIGGASETDAVTEMDALLKRRRMDEDEDGDGQGRVRDSRGIAGSYDDDESVYACW